MTSNTISCNNSLKRKDFGARQDDSMSSDGNDRTSDSSPELHPATDTSGSDSSNSNKPSSAFDEGEKRRVKPKKSIWDSITSASADLVKPSHFGLSEFSTVKDDGLKKPVPPASHFAQTLTALAVQVQQASAPPLQRTNFAQPPSVLPTTSDPSHHIMELLKNATQASIQSLQQCKSSPRNNDSPPALTHMPPLAMNTPPVATQAATQESNELNRLSKENIDLVQTLIALSANNGRPATSTNAGPATALAPLLIPLTAAQHIPIAPALQAENEKDVIYGAFPMAMDTDDERMSSYQIMVRQQLEFFIADKKDVESSTQGRKKPVVLGQVGIRCKHCAHVPQRSRVRGAVYFPTRLDGVYQAAQNMSTTHLLTSCKTIDEFARKKLLKLKETKLIAMAGKQEWAEACRKIGIYEVEGGGLRMTKTAPLLAAKC
ncbi:hypothetical protein FisN_1Lh016 [Fistulifera solaris]|uniref:Uncharacterized protein n=1 Tax=Fistulifera solaris TaxID=1519565 RepID=A0A1Z5JCX0_FISSO|nr:hypothetical protein FisN_1Lh016 [Fistulifera solaris]|eukprot:GAX11618.1 hypothetical protein FisN_1Lh016 [Fistulifera solaris]